MNLTKTELRDLEKHGYTITDKKPNGIIVDYIIVVSHGNKELHESGYPFIKIFGAVDKELVSLGWHDHYTGYVPTNTDSLGKNIFRVMPWVDKRPWKVSEHFLSISSFTIGEYGDNDYEFIILQ